MSGVPRTPAGKALVFSVGRDEPDDWDAADWQERIAAIEVEAVQDWLRSPEAEKALAEFVPVGEHSQRCPIWLGRNKEPRPAYTACDCWVLPREKRRLRALATRLRA